MDINHLQELIELEDTYWWHIAKRELVTSLLVENVLPPARVVEGGIGSARNLEEFQKLGYQVAGLDLLEDAVLQARSRGIDDAHVHDLAENWPFDSGTVDAVVLLDVLEHIEHPVQVLRHAGRVLSASGRIVFTVPAYPWLYGDWDEQLGHFRRYTKQLVRSQVEAAGLTIEWLSFWNAFSLPAAAAVRSYQRCFPRQRAAEFPRVNPLVNRMLQRMAAMERWCLHRAPVPFGLSLVGVLAK